MRRHVGCDLSCAALLSKHGSQNMDATFGRRDCWHLVYGRFAGAAILIGHNYVRQHFNKMKRSLSTQLKTTIVGCCHTIRRISVVGLQKLRLQAPAHRIQTLGRSILFGRICT